MERCAALSGLGWLWFLEPGALPWAIDFRPVGAGERRFLPWINPALCSLTAFAVNSLQGMEKTGADRRTEDPRSGWRVPPTFLLWVFLRVLCISAFRFIFPSKTYQPGFAFLRGFA